MRLLLLSRLHRYIRTSWYDRILSPRILPCPYPTMLLPTGRVLCIILWHDPFTLHRKRIAKCLRVQYPVVLDNAETKKGIRNSTFFFEFLLILSARITTTRMTSNSLCTQQNDLSWVIARLPQLHHKKGTSEYRTSTSSVNATRLRKNAQPKRRNKLN